MSSSTASSLLSLLKTGAKCPSVAAFSYYYYFCLGCMLPDSLSLSTRFTSPESNRPPDLAFFNRRSIRKVLVGSNYLLLWNSDENLTCVRTLGKASEKAASVSCTQSVYTPPASASNSYYTLGCTSPKNRSFLSGPVKCILTPSVLVLPSFFSSALASRIASRGSLSTILTSISRVYCMGVKIGLMNLRSWC